MQPEEPATGVFAGTLGEIAHITNVAHSVDEAARETARLLARDQHWIAGQLYLIGSEADRRLRPTHGRWASDPSRLEPFFAVLESTPAEVGRPVAGTAAAAGQPKFWARGGPEPDPPWSTPAATAGVHACLAFPVRTRDAVAGVFELYAEEPAPPGPGVIEASRTVGVMLGQMLERRALERMLAKISAKEQQRIGRELHDGLGQQLTAIGLLAATLQQRLEGLDAGKERDLAARLSRSIDAAKSSLRNVSRALALTELDPDGLPAALETLIEASAVPGRVECSLDCPSSADLGDRFTATQVYRIAQEAVNNSLKHGDPRRIEVSLQPSGSRRWVLEVRDDGCGLPGGDSLRDGMGLRIMRHRASMLDADLELTAGEAGGTVVRCDVPMPPR